MLIGSRLLSTAVRIRCRSTELGVRCRYRGCSLLPDPCTIPSAVMSSVPVPRFLGPWCRYLCSPVPAVFVTSPLRNRIRSAFRTFLSLLCLLPCHPSGTGIGRAGLGFFPSVPMNHSNIGPGFYRPLDLSLPEFLPSGTSAPATGSIYPVSPSAYCWPPLVCGTGYGVCHLYLMMYGTFLLGRCLVRRLLTFVL